MLKPRNDFNSQLNQAPDQPRNDESFEVLLFFCLRKQFRSIFFFFLFRFLWLFIFVFLSWFEENSRKQSCRLHINRDRNLNSLKCETTSGFVLQNWSQSKCTKRNETHFNSMQREVEKKNKSTECFACVRLWACDVCLFHFGVRWLNGSEKSKSGSRNIVIAACVQVKTEHNNWNRNSSFYWHFRCQIKVREHGAVDSVAVFTFILTHKFSIMN